MQHNALRPCFGLPDLVAAQHRLKRGYHLRWRNCTTCKTPDIVHPALRRMDDATRKTARAGTTVELKIIVTANTDYRLAGAAKVGNDRSMAGRAGNRLKLDSHRMIIKMQPAVRTLSGQKPFGRLVYLTWPYPQPLGKEVALSFTGRFAAANRC